MQGAAILSRSRFWEGGSGTSFKGSAAQERWRIPVQKERFSRILKACLQCHVHRTGVSQGLRQEEVFSFDSSRYDLRGQLGGGPSLGRGSDLTCPGLAARLLAEAVASEPKLPSLDSPPSGWAHGRLRLLRWVLSVLGALPGRGRKHTPPPFTQTRSATPPATIGSDYASVGVEARFPKSLPPCAAMHCHVMP